MRMKKWLDDDGTWLVEPEGLLRGTSTAWLVGTAPELLSALKATVEALKALGCVENKVLTKANAAIKKASRK